MASVKFLEEALSTDVDESAVSAIVGSLENQLVTSTPQQSGQQVTTVVINQNHINTGISNGGTVAPQKHGTIANGDSISVSASATNDGGKQMTNNAMIISGAAAQTAAGAVTTAYLNNNQNASTIDPNKQEGVKIVYTQGQQNQPIIQNRVAISNQSLPNGTLGLSPQTVLQTTPANLQTKQQTLVLKAGGNPGAPGLVTVPMNAVTSSVPQANNQLTLQSFHGLQPGQQGALLVKTENGQFQLLRVGPAPQAANIGTTQTGGQPVTFRMQTVPASSVATSPAQAGGTTTVVSSTPQPIVVQQSQPVQVQRPANDNTKEKCRKFLANLLELSSREPKAVERNVRSLIQELIDNKVEPEDFCDKLERLLNASPQPCLIGFLKKSLPLLRHSLATQELTIDGIRPPPANVVFSIAGATPTVQTIRPGGVVTAGGVAVQSQQPAAAQQQVQTGQQVRIVGPGTTVVRPGQVLQQRLVAPIRAPAAPRMVTAIRQPIASNNVIVSSSQPPALHPVFPSNQVRPAGGAAIRQPVQVRTAAPGGNVQMRQQASIRTAIPAQNKQLGVVNKAQGGAKPSVPSASRPTTKEKQDKKTFAAAYTAPKGSQYLAGDDDINDVAAMGGVNLAEETQKILGSTEFVGTQIRSCKEDIMCSLPPLQQKIRKIMQKHGLEEPNTDVAACISHAAQERLKNLLEKLAVITEHRLEIVKSDQRYEITNDVKGQLKFLEDLDKAERKKHEELEREMLLRAAKSRSKTEDPEQAKLKAKAKEMQRVEMEELRQREANATALQAIGPRKKPRLDGEFSGNSQASSGSTNSTTHRGQMPLRQRMKKVTLRDLQFLFETEKDLCKSKLLYKSYLK